MAKVYCPHHRVSNVQPVMIYFGESSLGKQYICAVCSGVRVFNCGPILSFNPEKQFGFINGTKSNVFFHMSNLSYDFRFHVGMDVSYEIAFLENDRIQAVNIKPINMPGLKENKKIGWK
ncbi:MAG: cold shock domain-containing protein [Desulfobacterales bacterium]|nr:cold shock domain-containing protein [Desulfobacterales bacterium]